MQLPFITVRTRSAAETTGIGRALGQMVRPGDVLLLIGELGSGKTTFVKGFASGLEVDETATSPSYTLMHTYEGRYPLLHVDLFRCDHSQEVVDLGLEEMLDPPWVVVIEWGEKAGPIVSDDYLEVELSWDDVDDDIRTLQMRPVGRWRERMGLLTDSVRGWISAEPS